MKKEMTTLERLMLNALVGFGGALPAWSVQIIEIDQKGYSDYATVKLYLTKPRCRKPDVYWEICVDMARGLAHFDRSTHQYLKTR